MGSGYFLVRRSLCHHARSHPFVLRTEYFSSSTAEEMDRVLEKSCDTRMDEPLAGSNLAARILGPPVAPRRIVRREMAIVKNNPVRHGYVSRVEDRPYQGDLN